MEKSVKERCDKIIGSGTADFMTIAGYKVGEGKEEEGRYAYGANFDYPDFEKITEADKNKLLKIAVKRVRSVSQAPFKAKILAGEMTEAEVQAWYDSVNGENFITFLNTVKEKAERAAKEPKDTLHSRILAQISGTLRTKIAQAWDFSTAKVAIPGAENPPEMVVGKDKKVVINFNAWSKLFTTEHPWYIQVKKDLEKSASKMD